MVEAAFVRNCVYISSFIVCCSGASESQVQEVLSSIRESSESDGQGSNSSLAACGDDPNMPSQQEVCCHSACNKCCCVVRGNRFRFY